MARRYLYSAFIAAIAVVACGGDDSASAVDGGQTNDASMSGADGSPPGDAGGAFDGSPSVDGTSPSPDAAQDAPADAGDLAQRLATLTAQCTVASTGKYATDEGSTPTVDICHLNGAFFWKADMDVDCDGQTTTQCSSQTDPDYQNQTSFNQSNNQPLSAAVLPYVVIPLPSSRFSYSTAGIKPGAVVIVLYKGLISYGVFGDEGPATIIGEASYAMAKSLGIDPDPSTGGTDSGVTYIAFTGQAAVASPIEDHQAAVTLGQSLANTLLANN